MKDIRNIVIAVLCLVLLAGCHATDQFTITSDGKVQESVTIMENNDKVLYGDKSLSESVEQELYQYEAALDVKGYTYDVVAGNKESGAKITNEYDDFCDVFTNTVFAQYAYNRLSCTSNGEYYEVSSIGAFKVFSDYDEGEATISSMKLVIKLPFSLEDENADIKSNNTYTWKFDKNSSNNKTVRFKVNKESFKNAQKRYKAEAKKRQAVEKRNKIIKNVVIVIIVVIALALLGLVAYKVLYKKYKENKIDY